MATPGSSLFDALENGAADYRIYQWRKGPVQGLVEATVVRGLVERSKRLDAVFAGQAPDRERWFPLERPDTARGYQVFALPYAGGCASVYRQWQLPGPWKLCQVQLPGRESRIAEPSIQDMTQLVRQLVDAIRPYTDKPWALLGCSLGCKVAFEVARALTSRGATRSCCSGWHARRRVCRSSAKCRTTERRISPPKSDTWAARRNRSSLMNR
nr:thioesterase domain-containing protein [Pseudomonas fluorescens]